MKKALRHIGEGRQNISKEMALDVLLSGKKYLAEILEATHMLRQKTFGRQISLCQITSIKTAVCSEDCCFCAQSQTATYPPAQSYMASVADIHTAIARTNPYTAYIGFVSSGKSASFAEINLLQNALPKASLTLRYCASLGILSLSQLSLLKKAGLYRYHHNLETSEQFFPAICQSHTWQERYHTLLLAQKVGLSICSGGIFGVGETHADRVSLAFSVKAVGANAIPLNFFTPLPETALSDVSPLDPLDILLTMVMFRLVNPTADIRIAAGRKQLGTLQSFAFMAGVSGMMIGDLLTTTGSDMLSDLTLLSQLGYRPTRQ